MVRVKIKADKSKWKGCKGNSRECPVKSTVAAQRVLMSRPTL